jgi:hypothetical protein
MNRLRGWPCRLVACFLLAAVLTGCVIGAKTGKVKYIEYNRERVERKSWGAYLTWEEVQAAGMDGLLDRYEERATTPTGFVVVTLEDGSELRAKNPFPDIKTGDSVGLKETQSGDWVLTR